MNSTDVTITPIVRSKEISEALVETIRRDVILIEWLPLPEQA